MTEAEFRAAVVAEIDCALAEWRAWAANGQDKKAPVDARQWADVLRLFSADGGIINDLMETWY